MENLQKITNNDDETQTNKRKSKCGGMALNSCAFVSFNDFIKNNEPEKPFLFLMSCLMLGTGVGYDTYYDGELKRIYIPKENEIHIVGDSRDGWTKSVELLLQSYFHENKKNIIFDYSRVERRERLKKFGGITSGPESLKQAHEKIKEILTKYEYI